MAGHPTENVSGYKTFLDDDSGDFDDGVPYLVELNSDGLTVVPVATVGNQFGIFAGKLDTTATGDNLNVNVRFLNAGGTARLKTSGAVTQKQGGAPVSAAVGGTIIAGSHSPVGRMLGATAASGDIVEVQIDQNIPPEVGTLTLAAAATTFAVNAHTMVVTGDAGANVIATITGAYPGMVLKLIFVDAFITFTDDNTHAADTIDLLGVDEVSADDETLTLVYDGTSWYELSKSTND